MSETYIIASTGVPPVASHVPLPLQHLSCLADGLMQEMQLAEDKCRIERIARVCAHIHNIQTLVDQVSHRHKLLQN